MVFYYFNSVNEFRYSLMENVQMDHRHIFLRNLALWFSASKFFFILKILSYRNVDKCVTYPMSKIYHMLGNFVMKPR